MVAFVWELTKENIDLPLGCLQVGISGQIKAACDSEMAKQALNPKT